MTDHDKSIFSEAMVVLGHTFNETISPIKIAAYFDALSDHRIEDVVCATRTLIRSQHFFPKPIDFLRLLSGTADDAWGEVLREIQRIGYVGTPRFKNPITLDTVVAIAGSWQRLCEVLPNEGPERIGWMKQFRSAFEVMSARHQEHTLTLQSADPTILRAIRAIADAKSFPQ